MHDQVFKVSSEVLSVLDENREQLELLINWCDLCLPANDSSFAEAHRLKVRPVLVHALWYTMHIYTHTCTAVTYAIERQAANLHRCLQQQLDAMPRCGRGLLV